MKPQMLKLITILTILQVIVCLRVHATIQPVTFVTPSNNPSSSFGSTIIDYKYYDNIQSLSANYYYGSITKDAYDMHIKQYQSQNYQKCYQQLPYSTPNAQSCMKCPKDKPLFNLGTRQCEVCRTNINNKCNAILTEQAASANTQPNPVNNTTTNTPVTNSTATPNTANTSNTSNTSNPTTSTVPTTTSNPTTSNAATSNTSAGNTSNNSANSSVNTANSSNSGSSLSNSSSTVSSNQSSSNASYPYVFEWQPKVKNETNSSSLNQSVDNNGSGPQYIQAVPLGSNTTNTNSGNNSSNQNFPNYTVIVGPTANNTVNNGTVLIAANSQPEVKFQSAQCPLATPLYNVATKKCEACPSTTQYVYAQKKCLNFIYATDPRTKYIILNSPDQIINKNYDIQKKYPTRTITYCPISTPYQINGTCNQCLNGSLYNATSQKCQTSCPEGQVYNQITSKCVNGTYITNPSAPTLLSPLQNYDSFKKQQQNLLQSSFIYVRCPLNNPISVNNKCTQCPIQTPYFNIDSKKCEQCSKGRYFNGETRTCKGDYNEGLQIYRMIPNIV